MSTRTTLRYVFIGLIGVAMASTAFLAVLLPKGSASTASAQTPAGVKVDFVSTFITPMATVDLDKGERDYGEADLFRPGESDGGTPIGQFKWIGIATEPPGTHGLLFWGYARIFGKGEIHVSVVAEVQDGVRTGRGVITGGTGAYRGVEGVYSDEWLLPGPGLSMRFSFNP